jgi:hypothetical protein
MVVSEQVPLPSDVGADLAAQLHRWAASSAMRDLVAAFGGSLPEAGTAGLLAWLDEFSARHWDFRTARRVERHQVEEPELSPALREAAVRTATALGFVASEPPPLRDYDHLLVLGGMAGTCLRRSRYAALLLGNGVRAGQVTALGSFRPLGPDEASVLPEPAGFEVDALQVGLGAAFGVREVARERGSAGEVTHESWAVRSLNERLHVLAAPSSEPAGRRANTADTYRFWAGEAGLGAGDRVLIVTSPIYVPFQHCDALRMLTLPYGCLVHTVGLPAGAGRADRYLQELRSAVRSMRRLLAVCARG